MKSLKSMAIESVQSMLVKVEKHIKWLLINKKYVPPNIIKENFALRKHIKERLKEYQEYDWKI